MKFDLDNEYCGLIFTSRYFVWCGHLQLGFISAIFIHLLFLLIAKLVFSTIIIMWAAELDADTTAETSAEDVMYCERVAFAVKNMILDCQSSFPDTSSSSIEMSSSSYTPPVGNPHQSPCRNPPRTPKSASKKKQFQQNSHHRHHPHHKNHPKHHQQSRQRKQEDWEISNITMATQCLVLDNTAGPLSSTFKPVQEISDLNVSMETCCGEEESNEVVKNNRPQPSGVDSNEIQVCHFSSGYSSCGSGRSATSSSTSLTSLSSCSRMPPAPPTSFASPESLQSASQIYYSSEQFPVNGSPDDDPEEDSLLDEPGTPVSRRMPCEGRESGEEDTPVRGKPYLSTFYRFTPTTTHHHQEDPIATANNNKCCCKCGQAQNTPINKLAAINMTTDSDITMFQDIPLCRKGVALTTQPVSPKSKPSSFQTIGRKFKKFRKHLLGGNKASAAPMAQPDSNDMKTLAIL